MAFGAWKAVRWWDEMDALEAQAHAEFDAYLDRIDGHWGALAPLTKREQGLLRRSPNRAHLRAAERYGTEPAATRAEAAERLADLVRRRSDSLVTIAPATHSVPYFTPLADATVDTIAARFQQVLIDARLPLYTPVITSALRTEEDQRKLRRVNVNAARGRSSHEFATTFDLHAEKFVYAGLPPEPPPPIPEKLHPLWREPLEAHLGARAAARFEESTQRDATRLKAALGRVLIELENEGRLLTILERRQPVYHTTAIGWGK